MPELHKIPAPSYAQDERPVATATQREAAKESANWLLSSVAEGERFWAAVDARLRAIAAGEPLK